MFKKLLPVVEPPPGAASFVRLWVNDAYVVTIRHEAPDTASGFGFFEFTVVDADPDPKLGRLVKLLHAESQEQNHEVRPIPTGEFLWINSIHIFAIGSYMPSKSNHSHTVIWTNPSEGDLILDVKKAYHVLLPSDQKPDHPYSYAGDSKPYAVAKVLGIDLEDPA